MNTRLLTTLFILATIFPGLLMAESGDPSTIVMIENQVDRAPRTGAWKAARLGEPMDFEERIRTGEFSRAAIELSTGGVIRLNEFTAFSLRPPRADQGSQKARIDLAAGVAYFFNRTEVDADITTPTSSLNIRGTEFVVAVEDDGSTRVTMVNGLVDLSNDLGTVSLTSGEQGIAESGQPPRKTAVLGATREIQWFLYYPAVLDLAELGIPIQEGDILWASLLAYRDGDLLGALDALPERLPSLPAEGKLYLGALLLATGQVDAAQPLVAEASKTKPELAQALGELVRTVLQDPTFQPTGDPQTASGWLARSYYLQSQKHLAAAREAVLRATEMSPEFGFAWARLAELEFSFGNRAATRIALDRALQLSPRNAQAMSLCGYIALAESQPQQAVAHFQQAIEIDSALGNAWLGWGLERFNQGDSETGILYLQRAVIAEPDRSFLRSYLGKGFAEVKDTELALEELGFAIERDAGDPTPYLYRALIDQQQARFNPAVESLEESIRLNDNRALFRSSFLLDQDRAVRQSNLAKIYENVGMLEPSLEEARKAVINDYSNSAAHLFLSNSINAQRDPTRISLRNESAWFNELLIANLLAPAGDSLLPQNISQQEYAAFFPRNRFSFHTDTRYSVSGELLSLGTVATRFGNTSLAIDYDVFHDDGTRPNQDVERYTAYIQLKHAITPSDSIYLNVKFQDSESGDLNQYYNQASADPDFRVEQEQLPLAILGYQHTWSPRHKTLLLASYLPNDFTRTNNGNFTVVSQFTTPQLVPQNVFSTITNLEDRNETTLYNVEAQHIYEDSRNTLVAGLRASFGELSRRNEVAILDPAILALPNPPPGTLVVDVAPDVERIVPYLYATREVIDGLWLTAGIAYEHQESPENIRNGLPSSEQVELDEVLPKVGAVWTPLDSLTLRAAFAKSAGGPTFDESVRLQPTQVAGFTESFRTLVNESFAGALDAPVFETFGISASVKLPTRTYLGAEYFHRWAESDRTTGIMAFGFPSPAFLGVSQLSQSLNYEERGFTLYAHQLIGDSIAIGAQYTLTDVDLDRIETELNAAGLTGFSQFDESAVHEVSAFAIWNHSSGWFARVDGRWLQQSNRSNSRNEPGDDFCNFSASAGKRLLDNRLRLEAGIENIADQDFQLNPLVTLREIPRERAVFFRLRADF